MVSAQTLWVVMVSVVLIVGALPVLRTHAVRQGLRATAINRNGAQLMGISPALAGG